MLSWIRSWWGRPTEREEEMKYEGTPVVTVRDLKTQYEINDRWWGTQLRLAPLSSEKETIQHVK